MDDCVSGSSDLNEFETLKTELSQCLQKGGMYLLNWCCSRTPTHEPQTFPLNRNSEEAFGAVIYLQSGSISNDINNRLLCSKKPTGKVFPCGDNRP
ncbi:hypothetical protein NPIL_177391 [Nephila pilipes]|uniref:Uncharacterized protein n=1 Tax=Nephila pilipes TaxID=299642 RepID=A0A8X6NLB8_NEPPI|nr:hypothetical protein NPIL_177391 [Nephila pilipes]